jgi:peptidoglycan/xylan/chitin deacetylase (PgdA/CDA1 family)
MVSQILNSSAVRLDGFITLNFVHPFRRALSRFQVSKSARQSSGRSFPVPILMYHSITDDPEPGVAPYYRLNTSPSVFRQQMQFLADHSYRTISLDQMVELLNPSLTRPGGHSQPSDAGGAEGDGRFVVLTFDDGFRNFRTEAFPVLQKHGFTGTVFLPTAFIGGRQKVQSPRLSAAPHSLFATRHSRPDEFLTWSEVRELHKAGIEFGSHTVNHPKLVELYWPDVEREISQSKSEIEEQLAQPITAFCYPYAFPKANRSFSRSFRELLAQTGYTCCTTTELGRVQTGDDRYRLKRLPANSLDDQALLAAKLEGSYDWLALPQMMVGKLKARPAVQPLPVNVES